jgi:hypothetical protein
MHGHLIENGSAFARATLDLEKYLKVVLADSARVRRGGPGKNIQIFMKKSLEFRGHPPKPMSIRAGRKIMGCAVKEEGDALVVATFGEWQGKEGAANVRATLVVPSGIEVKRRIGLSGPDSAAQGKEFDLKKFQEWYWYTPTLPAAGWTAILDVPDPDRQAD